MWVARLIDKIFRNRSQEKANATTIAKGRTAEDMAGSYLKSVGYRIIERNFRCKVGEIDLIAWHKEDLVFVEVKSTHSPDGFDPILQVNAAKRRKLIRAAKFYITRCFQKEPNSRFDVVAVRMTAEPNIEIIQNAFDAEGRPV